MRTPCDSVGQSADAQVACKEAAKPWILVATILASSMAFIDSTVINVALPALQASFHATVVDVQWVTCAAAGSSGEPVQALRNFVGHVALSAGSDAFIQAIGLLPSIRHPLL